jgi:hypothetical protein
MRMVVVVSAQQRRGDRDCEDGGSRERRAGESHNHASGRGGLGAQLWSCQRRLELFGALGQQDAQAPLDLVLRHR